MSTPIFGLRILFSTQRKHDSIIKVSTLVYNRLIRTMDPHPYGIHSQQSTLRIKYFKFPFKLSFIHLIPTFEAPTTFKWSFIHLMSTFVAQLHLCSILEDSTGTVKLRVRL